tara:strand:- start:444 stop:689 length:246 start_codon:yes stop_codon:yes gene_type:complete
MGHYKKQDELQLQLPDDDEDVEPQTIAVSFQVVTTMPSDQLFDIIEQFVSDLLPNDIETYGEYMVPDNSQTLSVGPTNSNV